MRGAFAASTGQPFAGILVLRRPRNRLRVGRLVSRNATVTARFVACGDSLLFRGDRNDIVGRFERNPRGFLLREFYGAAFAHAESTASNSKLDSKSPPVVGAKHFDYHVVGTRPADRLQLLLQRGLVIGADH